MLIGGTSGAIWFLFALSGMVALLITYHEFFGAMRIDDAERERAAATALALVRHLGGGVVLVDDDPSMLHLLGLLLSTEGIPSRGASSLDEALPFHPEDIMLVTDWRLRRGTGADIIAAYRKVHPTAPVLVVSAVESVPDVWDENVARLSKPFDPTEFLMRVQRCLETQKPYY